MHNQLARSLRVAVMVGAGSGLVGGAVAVDPLPRFATHERTDIACANTPFGRHVTIGGEFEAINPIATSGAFNNLDLALACAVAQRQPNCGVALACVRSVTTDETSSHAAVLTATGAGDAMRTSDQAAGEGHAKRGDRHVRPGRVRVWLDAVWKPIGRFLDQDPLTLAASIAFYSALSFAPIIVLGLWLAAHLSPGSEQRFIEHLGGLLGSQVKEIAVVVTENADRNLFERSTAGIISVITLFVSASTAFAQLQAAINTIWEVRVQPTSALWSWIRRRLLSFGMLAVIGFLLIVALVMSTLMTVVLSREGAGWAIANEVVTLAVFTLAFAALFRYVPDARVPMRYALLGGALTAVLFEVGKWALGAYLGSTTTADAYGAASSLILLLVWVYYSAIIVLVGAAVTRLLADVLGGGVGELAHSEVVAHEPAPREH